MAKSEREFIEEALTPEELAQLNGEETAHVDEPTQVVDDNVPEGHPDPGASQPAQVENDAQEPKTVDIRALQEARAEKRRLEEELAKIREERASERAERARIEERLTLLQQAWQAAQQQNQPQQPPPPSEAEDPLGYLDWKVKTLEQQLQERLANERKIAETAQLEQQRQAAIARADTIITLAAQRHPDISEAIQAAGEGIKQDIMRQIQAGRLRPEQAAQVYNATLAQYAMGCPSDPDEAAEYARRHARFYGWQPKAPEQPVSQAPAATQPAPVVTQPSPQELAARQERHMSLSVAQGGQPPQPIDAKRLAEMSEEDFFALMRTVNGRHQVEKVLSGV